MLADNKEENVKSNAKFRRNVTYLCEKNVKIDFFNLKKCIISSYIPKIIMVTSIFFNFKLSYVSNSSVDNTTILNFSFRIPYRTLMMI